MLTPMTMAALTIQPIDGNDGFAEVKLDNVKMIGNYSKIVHIIDMNNIMEVINALEGDITRVHTAKNKMLLEHELEKIKAKAQTLLPTRQKRGLVNILGTGLKWIAGTMNDDDRVEIEEHLKVVDENNHNAIENLNKNIYINDHFNRTLNRLKTAIDTDRKTVLQKFNAISKNDDRLLEELNYVDVLLKLKILSDDVERIQNNIASAKLNVMTSNILTDQEIIDFGIDFYELQYIQLGAARYRNDHIIFVIKFPKDMITVRRSLMTPMTDDNSTQLNFEPQEIIYYNGTIYDYEQHPDIGRMKRSNLCIYRGSCRKIKQYKQELMEIEPGLVLLKNSNGICVTSNCDERTILVRGNYLFAFHDCQITVGNETFSNSDKIYKDNFIIPSRDQVQNDDLEPTFDDIVLSEMENVKQIEELKYHKTFSNNSIVVIFIIIIVIILLSTMSCMYMMFKQNSLKRKIQENFYTKGGGVTSQQAPTPAIFQIDWQK